MGRAILALVAKDRAQHLERRCRGGRAVVDVVARRDDEDAVVLSSSRQSDVELGAGRCFVDEYDRLVGRRRLCLVDGERVAEGDLVFDVARQTRIATRRRAIALFPENRENRLVLTRFSSRVTDGPTSRSYAI